MLSSRITTSFFISTSRLARSRTSSATSTCRAGIFVEGRIVNLAIDFALQIGHLFRSFVHQQNDQDDIGMIHPDRLRDFLQQNRLADARRAPRSSRVGRARAE